ncbi:MAG: hypothetical protein MUD00_00050 [Candidatus Pacebacteria bacterium]|jgi:flagellar basal body-associated protein FliL|nr:hypothetical protein [Candidatus Paceibacterota bacterium]
MTSDNKEEIMGDYVSQVIKPRKKAKKIKALMLLLVIAVLVIGGFVYYRYTETVAYKKTAQREVQTLTGKLFKKYRT